MASNKNRVALIGKIGCGKTTLVQCLSNQEIHYAKTQMVTYTDHFIDTPGEFVELPFFCRQAINVSCDAGLVVLISSSTDEQNKFSPNFIFTYNIPTIGVVTKIDSDKSNIKRSRRYLEYAGLNKKRIYEVSALTGEGIPELVEAIHRYVKI
jgi:ethanolamine utilization protein EutP